MNIPLQLDLLKRRRAQPEFRLACSIADLLAKTHAPGVVFSHFPSGERRDEVAGARLRRMGLKRGWPDFLIIVPPDGRVHGLELKAGGRLSKEQREVASDMQRAGARWACAHGYDEAEAILQSWGALRISRRAA